jgi:hypothetical protein
VDGSPFFTIRDLHLGVTQRRAPAYDGTWGVWLKNAADTLITRFNVSAVFTQDFGVQACQVRAGGGGGAGNGRCQLWLAVVRGCHASLTRPPPPGLISPTKPT